MKIRTKILLVFLPSIVLALSCITGLLSWQLHNEAVESYKELSSVQLNQTGRYIQLFWEDIEKNIVFLADLPEAKLAMDAVPNFSIMTSPTKNQRSLFKAEGQILYDLWQTMTASHPEYTEIYYAYINGAVGNSFKGTVPAGYDPRKRSWFINGMKYPDQRITKSPAYRSITGELVAPVSAKIRNNSEIIGFASIDVTLGTFNHLMNSLRYGKTGRYLLVEKNGRILVNTADKDTVFKKVQELNNPELVQLATGGDGLTKTTMHGKKVYANVLTANDYKIIAIADADEVLAGMWNALTKILLVSIFLLIVLACITWFLARSIGNPLNRLTKASDKISYGDYDALPDLSLFSGELNSLAKSMSRMITEIKNKIGFAEGSQKAIPIPAAVIGADFTMEWSNQDMLDLHGIKATQEEIIGWQAGTFFFDDESRRTLSHEAIEQKKRLSKEINYTNRNGEKKVILVTTSPFYDLDGELLGAFSFWMDMTDIRTQQQQIEEQNKKIAATAQEAFSVADQMAGASEELSAQVEQSSKGTDIQRERVSETVTSMEEMNTTVLEVARNASGAAEGSDNAKTKAEEGQTIVKNTMRAIKEVENQAQVLKDNMEQLGQQAEEIGTVMNVIADIADQTNLLALNAAIEAARAGEYGRGFAVVADEVRKLAEKTMTATKEVGDAIEHIQEGTRSAVKNMENSVASVEEATKLSESSEQALAEIVNLIETASDQVRSIATASEEQSASSEEINMAIGEINRISTETAEAMEQSAQAVSDLARLAQELNRLISDLQNA